MATQARLGELLIEAGLLSEEQLAALGAGRRTGDRTKRLETMLLEAGIASEEEIVTAIAERLKLPIVELATFHPDPEVVALVPRHLAQKHRLLPLAKTAKAIQIAMADPTDLNAIDDLRIATGVGRVKLAVATMTSLLEAESRFYSTDVSGDAILDRLRRNGDLEQVTAGAETPMVEVTAQTAPVVKLLDTLLADAIRGRATDLHVEPKATGVAIRHRVDGLLQEVTTLPKEIQSLLVSRIKITAGMNIAERRLPQDGRGRIVVDHREIDTRISTIPTLQGEKVVIRLLPKSSDRVSLGQLGLEDGQRRLMEQRLAAPQGLIIFTGPTGAGKTSTMYSALGHLKSPEKNVVTLEDPIEYQIPEINQVQIDERSGITFARGLRSILRQDPDVIMVGEIRDLETARIVMQCALTGHLVLSSLHTNDAPSAVTRLLDLGVEPFLISSALSLVVAQRLVRVVCTHCAVPAEPNLETLALLGTDIGTLEGGSPVRGEGCDYCAGSGYRGRTGIYDLLPMSTSIRDLLGASGATHNTPISRLGLREAGMRKVKAGVTTLEEVLRVTYSEHDADKRCPTCSQVIDASFVICPHCRTDLEGKKCGTCSRAVNETWKACPYCRSGLGNDAFEQADRADNGLRIQTMARSLTSDLPDF